VRRVGLVGSLVWDVIHGRDPLAAPVEEWGGIAYALAGLDASLPDDWEIVPLVKVGRDLAPRAAEFLATLTHLAPGSRCIEVDAPNNRVVLHYQQAERRCERMSGGVPGWTWPELGPMVRDLDALYVNFISGFEMSLGTAQLLRHAFAGPIYADLHSLFLGMRQDGMRTIRPLPDAPAWFGCFDMVQVNEDEMRELSDDPLALSAMALREQVKLLVVTLGARGVAYVQGGGDGLDGAGGRDGLTGQGGPVRSALVSADYVEAVDPTGCGDVFGASAFSRLLAGDDVESALGHANRMAGRNATFRGATGLAKHLRGELVTP
jgi:sugar/nucleoside kinase (ribokinase family)